MYGHKRFSDRNPAYRVPVDTFAKNEEEKAKFAQYHKNERATAEAKVKQRQAAEKREADDLAAWKKQQAEKKEQEIQAKKLARIKAVTKKNNQKRQVARRRAAAAKVRRPFQKPRVR